EVAPILRGFLELSDASRIHRTAPGSDYPPQDVFGPEPEHDWCYYYERAELASQFKDYPEVIRLHHEATVSGYLPSNPLSRSPHEWLPFIRAYLQLENWEHAEEITLAVDQLDPNYRSSLCRLWQEAAEEEDSADASMEAFSRMTDRMGCEGPK
ncbi:MAG TPA: hypothetical protein VJA25_14595, partial [Dehalococcoidia bacterium]|nr:hypothetical protein [Dehalococcoidia bacterium]